MEGRDKFGRFIKGSKGHTKPHSEESKRLISKNNARWLKGKKLPAKWRKNLSLALKGMKKPWISEKRRGKDNPSWKGGRRPSGKYMRIHMPTHPLCDVSGYIFEHRFVIEQYIGRILSRSEPTHHLGKKTDNRLCMLMAFVNASAHRRYEFGKPVKPEEIIFDGRQYADSAIAR